MDGSRQMQTGPSETLFEIMQSVCSGTSQHTHTHTADSQKRWDLRSSRDRYFCLLIGFILHRLATFPLQYVSTYEDWWEPGIGQTYLLCCLHRLFSLSWGLLTAHFWLFGTVWLVLCFMFPRCLLWLYTSIYPVTGGTVCLQAVLNVLNHFVSLNYEEDLRLGKRSRCVHVSFVPRLQYQSHPAQTLCEAAADRYRSGMLPCEDQSESKIKSEAHLIWPGGKTHLLCFGCLRGSESRAEPGDTWTAVTFPPTRGVQLRLQRASLSQT